MTDRRTEMKRLLSEAYGPLLLRFAVLMDRELQKNSHKGDNWLKDSPISLANRAIEEARELRQCVPTLREMARGKPGAALVGAEAADVANFAMMVAHRTGSLDDGAVLVDGEPIEHDHELGALYRAHSVLYRYAGLDHRHRGLGETTLHGEPRQLRALLAELAEGRRARSELREMCSRESSVMAQLADARAMTDNVIAERDELRERVDDAATAVKDLEAEVGLLKSQLVGAKEDRDGRVAEIGGLKARLATMESQLKAERERTAEARALLEETKGDLAAALGSNARLQGYIDRVNEDDDERHGPRAVVQEVQVPRRTGPRSSDSAPSSSELAYRVMHGEPGRPRSKPWHSR